MCVCIKWCVHDTCIWMMVYFIYMRTMFTYLLCQCLYVLTGDCMYLSYLLLYFFAFWGEFVSLTH